MAGVSVSLRGVSKVYPKGHRALEPIDLDIRAGEFLVLLGPSGSGKTTLLRLIAGLESPTTGSIWFNTKDMTALAPRQRDVAMAFQLPALYPHLSVLDNLAFGLRARGMGKKKAMDLARVTDRLGLLSLFDRKPQTLSGGQQQRVGLGRAVTRQPAVCLFDEPLAALDAPLRATIRGELIGLHHSTNSTFVYVTHDQAEALALADRLAVLNEGRLVEVGFPRALYERPESRFVGAFLGSPPMNFVNCRVIRESREADWLWVDSYPRGRIAVTPELLERLPDGPVVLGVRPEHVMLARDGEPLDPRHAWFPGRTRVTGQEYLGHETLVRVQPNSTWAARMPGSSRFQEGDQVAVGVDLDQARWFDAEKDRVIPADFLADRSTPG